MRERREREGCTAIPKRGVTWGLSKRHAGGRANAASSAKTRARSAPPRGLRWPPEARAHVLYLAMARATRTHSCRGHVGGSARGEGGEYENEERVVG